MRPGHCGFENFVLAEESGETRDSGDGERADQHRPIGDGNLFAQAAHLRHFLLAAHGVNHAAGREEQQALEERVGHQMEDARAIGSHAAGKEHVAELGDGGVGENFFDIGLQRGRWWPNKTP